MISNMGQLDSAMEQEGLLLVSSELPLVFSDLFLYFLFLFKHRVGGRGMVGYHMGRCWLRRSDHPLYSPVVRELRRQSC
jgi:hypothetical protein